MDKLSAVLISAICLLLCVSTAVVYGTWFSDEKDAAYASSLKQIEEEMALANIAMNDDVQVINGGCQDMWIRARVDTPEQPVKTGTEGYDDSYKLVSDTIKEHPSKEEIALGVWTEREDGYYYYSVPVRPGEQSRPLFQSVLSSGKTGDLDGKSVKVQAEAVQVNWISKKAESGEEAFRLFGIFQPLQDYKGKFV